jgi:hypothetical protein
MPAASPPDPAPAGPRWIRWAIGLLLLAVVASPVVSAGWSREHQDAHPEGDDATIVLLGLDTFSAHPPLLGMISTGGAALDDPELHHPGPLEMYLLSPFATAGGAPVPGVTVATVAVNVAALAGLAWALRLLDGAWLAGVGLVAAGFALWGLGGDVPASVWNPFIVALPFAAFLALAVTTVAARPMLLPWTLGVGSFVMQTHLSYVGMVGLLSIWTVGAVGWRTTRDPALRPVRGRLAAWSAGVVGVLWAAPVWQQLTGEPGNLSQIVRSALGPGGPTAGTSALGELGRVVGVPVAGLRPRPDIVRVLPDLDATSAVALGLPWAVLGLLAWAARRRGDHTVVRALATVAVALLGAAVTATRIPLSDGVLYQYYSLWMWPLGALTWLLLGWAAARTVRAPRDPRRGVAPRRLRTTALAGVGALVALALVVSLLPRPGAWEPWAAYRRIAGQVVPAAVDALPGDDSVIVRFRGGTAYLSTGSAVVLGVEAAGRDALVDPGIPTEVFPWTERRRADADTSGTALWVVSGADPADLPSGARLLVEVPTLTDHEQAILERDQAELVRALERDGLQAGPRPPGNEADRARLAEARRDPLAALEQGLVAQLATLGAVAPPGGDLHRVVTTARMAALAAEGTVRVYLTT